MSTITGFSGLKCWSTGALVNFFLIVRKASRTSSGQLHGLCHLVGPLRLFVGFFPSFFAPQPPGFGAGFWAAVI